MKPSIITRAVTLAGFALGAFALAAVAAGTWSAPTQAPPNGNVDAPINVGGTVNTPQYKTGGLLIGASSGMPANTLFDVIGTGVIGTLFSTTVNASNINATNTITAHLKVLPGQTTTRRCTKWKSLPYNDNNCADDGWTTTIGSVNAAGLVLTGDSSGNVTWQPLSSHTISIDTKQTSTIIYPQEKCAAGEVISAVSYATNGNIVGAKCSTVSITISN